VIERFNSHHRQLRIEVEFYTFEDNHDLVTPLSLLPHLAKPAYDAVRLMDNLDLWLSETVDSKNGPGWDVYSFGLMFEILLTDRENHAGA
jgi:hypothetical protein